MRRRMGLLLAWLTCAVAVAAFTVPQPASAAASWSWALSPLSLKALTPTNITVSVTAGADPLGCVSIKIPPHFTVSGMTVQMPSTWRGQVSGTGPATLTAFALTDAELLQSGAALIIVVRVTEDGSSPPSWNATAYAGTTCGKNQVGSTLTQPRPFTIIPVATPTPTPTLRPTPAPTPSPTSVPTGVPTPTPTSPPTGGPTDTPTIAPTVPPGGTLPPRRTPAPGKTPGSSGTPEASPSPTETPTPEPSPGTVAVVIPPTPEMPFPDPSAVSLDVGSLPAGGTVQLDSEAAGGMGMFAWAVPVAFLGLPGLVLILIVLFQAGFAWIFVPIARRTLGLGRRNRARKAIAHR